MHQLLAVGGGQYHAATNILSIFTILAVMTGLIPASSEKEKEVELQENGTQKESGKERLKRKGKQYGEP